MPAVIGAQMPLGPPVLAALADMHIPPHGEFAQKPSTQFPVMHWTGDEQVVPVACFTGATQTPPLQVFDWQSPLTLHCLPCAHTPQVPPPQSTSVSVPFFWASLHVAGGTVQAPLPLHVVDPAHSLAGS